MADESNSLRVRLVTPERILFEQTADAVELPAKNGYMEVLYGHAPLLAELGAGDVRIHGGGAGGEQIYNVNWGFVEVLPDRVTILASDALKPEEIDVNRAQQQLDRGLKMWNEAGDSEEAYDHALHVIAEAEAKLATRGREALIPIISGCITKSERTRPCHDSGRVSVFHLRLQASSTGVASPTILDVTCVFSNSRFCASRMISRLKEVQHVELELGGERDREPHAIRLWRIGHGEAQAGHIGPQQRAHRERNLARHRRGDQHRLIRGGVDVGVAAPAEVILLLRPEGNVKDVAPIHALAPHHAKVIVGLVLRGERKQVRADAVLRFVMDQVPAHVLHKVAVHAFVADAHADRFVVVILFFSPSLWFPGLLRLWLVSRRQRVIREVLVFRELPAVELEQLLRRSVRSKASCGSR